MAARLTPRQLECLRLSADQTDKEIARTLGISPHTVEKHIRAALEALSVSTRREARRRLGITANPPYGAGAMADPPGAASNSGADSDSSRSSEAQTWYRPPPESRAARLFLILAAMIGATVLGLGLVSIVSSGLLSTQELAPHNAR